VAFWNGKNSDEDVVGSSVVGSKVTSPTSSGNSSGKSITASGTPQSGPQSKSTPPRGTSTPSTDASEVKNLGSSSDNSSIESTGELNSVDLERFGKVRSALGPGTVIQGKLSFDTPVRIDGKLSGEIFSSKALIVGPQGWINAQIEVAALIVMGTVKGNVKATERVELFPGGKLDGDVSTPAFVMSDGSVFNGGCKMQQIAKAEKITENAIQGAADRASQVTAAVKGLGNAIAAGERPGGASAGVEPEAKSEVKKPSTAGQPAAR